MAEVWILSGRILRSDELVTFMNAGINPASIGAVLHDDDSAAVREILGGSLGDAANAELLEAAEVDEFYGYGSLDDASESAIIQGAIIGGNDPVDIAAASAFGASTTPLDVLDPLGLFHSADTPVSGIIPDLVDRFILGGEESFDFGGSALNGENLEQQIIGAGGGGPLAVIASTVTAIIQRSGLSDDIIRIAIPRTGTYTLRESWANLSSAQQATLVAAAGVAGLGIIDILDFPFDLGLLGGFGAGSSSSLTFQPGITLTPGWIANGVQFYYVSDGRLAVQNKRGRWKFWRPKKPIVLFATGAKDIRTMVRADKALNKQSKAIAGMLNRRAPRPRRSSSQPHHQHGDGPVSIVKVD